jgi:endonuclease/exonuclease/phosphatase family metal-dependent hydrolase
MRDWLFLLTAAMLLVTNACSTAEKSTANLRLRVMTYNIHHAEGTDGKVDLARIAKLITDNKVDLVALQEVDRGTARTSRIDMPAELSRLTGMSNAFGPNLDFQGGQYGNAILSRFPILSLTNHPLPKIAPGEQRGLLETTIQTDDGPVTFCSVHLDHRRPEEDRLAGVQAIRSILQAAVLPILIAGDFNARPESQTFARMSAEFRDSWGIGQGPGYTIPSEKPSSRIDYVWFKGPPGFASIKQEVLTSEASDHLPLLAEFSSRGECIGAPTR